jgi:type II secretory pathway component PulF
MSDPATTTRSPSLQSKSAAPARSARVPARTAASARAKGKGKGMSREINLFNRSGKPKEFNKKDLVQLFRGLGAMLRAQINTADALKYYGQALPNKVMVSTLLRVREDIAAGISIHDAFRRTGRFNDMTIGLIQAGSDAGQLHHSFRALAERITTEIRFRKAIRKAVLMPSIVIGILVGAFIVSQVKIVPQVEEMLDGVGAAPDGLTAISFKISHFTQATWPVFVISIIAFIVTVAISEKIRTTIMNLAMSKWRLLRMLVMSLRQMTFLGTIRLLHSNGINLAKSIRVSANSVKGTPFYQELRDAADKYEHSGVPLSTAFSKYTSSDPQVVHMLSIGEKSASLDSQLEMLTSMYEEEAENQMETFAAVIGFLVLLIAVGLISAVFIGTFLPIFLMGPKMMQSGI